MEYDFYIRYDIRITEKIFSELINVLTAHITPNMNPRNILSSTPECNLSYKYFKKFKYFLFGIAHNHPSYFLYGVDNNNQFIKKELKFEELLQIIGIGKNYRTIKKLLKINKMPTIFNKEQIEKLKQNNIQYDI